MRHPIASTTKAPAHGANAAAANTAPERMPLRAPKSWFPTGR